MLDKTQAPQLALSAPPLATDHNTEDQDNFRPENPNLVTAMQPATVVHTNSFGQIVILQERYPDDDVYVLISPEYVERVVAAIKHNAAAIREG